MRTREQSRYASRKPSTRHDGRGFSTEQGLRAALYMRISTDEKKQKWSIDGQRRRLREFCSSRNWTVVAEYSDEASGAILDRPGLMRALEDAARGKFDVVLFVRLDRFSRKLKHLLGLIDELEEQGVGIASAKESLDTTTPIGRMVIHILGAFAELEREMIRERIKDGVAARARKGYWQGSPPLGFKKVSGLLEPDISALPLALCIFHMYVTERKGTTAIARTLSAEGTPHPAGAPRWQSQHVITVLRSPAYIGHVRSHGALMEARHDAVIERDTWERAQELLAERAKHLELRRGNDSQYLPTALVRCGRCGRSFVGAAGHGRGGRYTYYRCQGRIKFGRGYCSNTGLRRDALENAVIEKLEDLLRDTPLLEDALARARTEEARSDDSRIETGEIRRKLEDVEKRRRRYLDAFEEGRLDPEQVSGRLEELAECETALRVRLNTVERDQLPEGLSEAAVTAALQTLGQLPELPTEQAKAFLRLLVKEVVVVSKDEVRCTFRLPLDDLEVRATTGEVEPAGLEPATSAMPWQRSSN